MWRGGKSVKMTKLWFRGDAEGARAVVAGLSPNELVGVYKDLSALQNVIQGSFVRRTGDEIREWL